MKAYLVENNQAEMLSELEEGEWMDEARRRYVDGLTGATTNQDDDNLITFLAVLSSEKAPFTALLGEMNLMDYFDDESADRNQWYRTLGVKPPEPKSVFLVYDYHGLNTASSYAVPALIRRSKLPPRRGPFGGIVEAPPLPPFEERARYVVRGVLRGMVGAVATAHGAGIVHRSIGRNSFLLSSTGQDKREATSPYSVVASRLRVVLSDWGFSASFEEATRDAEMGARSRMFDIPAVGSYEDLRAGDGRVQSAAKEFAMAEDLHALGLSFLAMLFTTLAEPATVTAPMPPTDDDSWQRLFTEIFEKDMEQFRDYCSNEEVWDSVVELLDRDDGAGWDLLGNLLLAREKLSAWYKGGEVNVSMGGEREGGAKFLSANELLTHPFFRMKI